MTVNIATHIFFNLGRFREMLRAAGPLLRRDPGRKDRPQVSAREAAPARKDVAGDRVAQGARPQVRRPAVHLLRGL